VRARAQDGGVGNHSLLAHREIERDMREHPRKKLSFGVVELANAGATSLDRAASTPELAPSFEPANVTPYHRERLQESARAEGLPHLADCCLAALYRPPGSRRKNTRS
jgi:hypothetical protein